MFLQQSSESNVNDAGLCNSEIDTFEVCMQAVVLEYSEMIYIYGIFKTKIMIKEKQFRKVFKYDDNYPIYALIT